MSALDQGVNGYSGKPSVKDKISCKIRFHAGKTAQKFRQTPKYKDQSEFAIIEQYSSRLKTQKTSMRNLNESWKKYVLKEYTKITDEFESILLRTFSAEDTIRGSIEKASIAFPAHNDPVVPTAISAMKSHVDADAKRVKDVDDRHNDYLVAKNVFEKAPESMKEDARHRMNAAHDKVKGDFAKLKEEIPTRISNTDEQFYQCMLEYYERKMRYLEDLLASMNHVAAAEYCLAIDPNEAPFLSTPQDRSPEERAVTLRAKTNGANQVQAGQSFDEEKHTDDTYDLAEVPETKSRSESRGECGQPAVDLTRRPRPFEVIAKFPYTTSESDELEFKADDVITVLEWADEGDEEPGWLYGELKKGGAKGLFPANYVKLPP